MFRRVSGRVVAALLLASPVLSYSAFAQVDRTALNGTVSDPAGHVLPQTHVTVTETATALRREAVTDQRGNYTVTSLPVGNYVVTFEHAGFAAAEFSGVRQVVGRTRTLDAHLRVTGSEEHIQVSTASAQMDRASAAVTGLIERKQADELPLNGRNWAALTAFIPGAVDTGGSNQRSIRFAGRGTDDSNFTYDGIDAGNIVNQTQRQWVRLAIPLDAISEFRVDTLASTAEVGATGGAQLDVTSPSGTNHLHGRLFEYLRNDAFDAPLPEWVPGGGASGQQPLRLNQFGASLGGPIVRDRTFFFAAAELYRQHWGFPVSADVPSQSMIASVAATSPVYNIMHGYPTAGSKYTITPYTPENDPGDPNYADYANLICNCSQVVNEGSYMLRVDHHFTQKTSAFMRFNYDRSVDTQPLSATAIDPTQKVSAPVNGMVELLHIFNSHLVNETKAAFNRSTDNQYNYSNSGIPYEIAVSTSVSSNGFLTENYDYISKYIGNSYSVLDNITWTHDRNTLKAGVEYRRLQVNQSYGEHGTITFNTIENLAANIVKKASLTGSMPANDMRKNVYAAYAQDEFKWKPNLTLNLGLRYTIFGIFDEAHGQANPFDFETCGAAGFCGIGASFGNQNYGDIDPRVAFTWAPYKSGRTVVRGGFGLYHEDGQLDDQNLPAKNEVPSYSETASSTNLLSYPVTFGAGTISPNAEQRTRKDSYVEQWTLSVEQELPAHFVSTISYLGSHGVHLLDTNVVNLIDPATGLKQYPDFAAAIAWRGSVGMSSYNALSANLRRAFTNGLLVAANYTLSHEIDNGSNGSGDGDNQDPQNPLCLKCDRASGNWDARNVLNANAVYQLPFGRGKSMLNHGLWSTVAGNWEMTATALARTGFPVNVLMPSGYTAADGASGTQRPDLVGGVSLKPIEGRSIAHWINPDAFTNPKGEFGTAPRNLLRGPGTWQVDTGIAKSFPLPHGTNLEFRSEFYNLFNHPQLGAPSATYNSANLNGFGAISTTLNLGVSPVTPVGTGTPREMQFALRLDF